MSLCCCFPSQLERRTIVKKIEVKADVVYIYLEKVSGSKNIWHSKSKRPEDEEMCEKPKVGLGMGKERWQNYRQRKLVQFPCHWVSICYSVHTLDF